MQEKNSLQLKRSVEEMQYLLGEQAAGDLTVKQFCKEHRLSEAVFYYWQKKLKGEKRAKASSAGFKEITVKADKNTLPEQVFAEYKGIRFYQEPSVSFLKQLIG
jgi:hypothetical protein